MRIKPEHYEHIEGAITAFLAQRADTRATYRAAGMTEMRWRWDVARAAGLIPYFRDTLDAYANDDHIDTALRSITGTK